MLMKNINDFSDHGCTINCQPFFVPCVDNYNNKSLIQIRDIQGQSEYKDIPGLDPDQIKIAIFMYSLSEENSDTRIDNLISCFLDKIPIKPKIIIIGNKSDCERKVPKDSTHKLARKFNAQSIETSCLNGDNLEESFKMIKESVISLNKVVLEDDNLKENQSGGYWCNIC